MKRKRGLQGIIGRVSLETEQSLVFIFQSFNFLFILKFVTRLYFLEQFQDDYKIEQKVQQRFPIYPLFPRMHSCPTIDIRHQNSTFVTIDESTLTRRYYPECIVYFRVHSSWLVFPWWLFFRGKSKIGTAEGAFLLVKISMKVFERFSVASFPSKSQLCSSQTASE